MLDTVPEGFAPGSEIANLSVMGYDVPKVYEGRGVLEAASMGVDILPGEMAMRCNLVCIEGDLLKIIRQAIFHLRKRPNSSLF